MNPASYIRYSISLGEVFYFSGRDPRTPSSNRPFFAYYSWSRYGCITSRRNRKGFDFKRRRTCSRRRYECKALRVTNRSALGAAKRSKPVHAVWVLKCSNATYKISPHSRHGGESGTTSIALSEVYRANEMLPLTPSIGQLSRRSAYGTKLTSIWRPLNRADCKEAL
jgi:hypothetical protein